MMKMPPKPVVPDNSMAVEALRIGAQRAFRIHKAIGNPIATFRDGKVAWIPPEEIQVDEPSVDGKTKSGT